MRAGLLIILLAAPWPSRADEPTSASPAARFQALLADAKSHPEKTDWNALRLAFSRTPAYRPYAVEELDRAPVEQELKNGERTAALHALDRVLEGHWVDPAAHDYAVWVCEKIDEPARARLHETFMKHLVDTILNAGNGQSFEGAWPVLTIREESLVLEGLHLKNGQQTLVHKGGHFYDVHTFKNPQTGQNLAIYFNVDLPRQWLRDHTPKP